jgi:acetylornithine deacetylase/succinyl-diaminopimelate desuccinylase-like protein
MPMLNKNKLDQFVDQFWHDSIIPALSEFIKIPARSINFDSDWEKNGYLLGVLKLISDWIKKQNLPGTKVEILSFPKKAPLLFAEIPGDSPETVLFYAHADKMPEGDGWDADLGPWKPVLKKGDRLYGRGSADNGYAPFSAMASILSLHNQKIKRPRCVILVETEEESGSPNIAFYLKKLKDRIGDPELILISDSGGDDYDHLWLTTSLRGVLVGVVGCTVLKRGIHSGLAGGIIPSAFRILRQLLTRVENEKTGEVLLKTGQVEIPKDRLKEMRAMSDFLGDKIFNDFPFMPGAKPVTKDLWELMLNSTWRSALSVIGIDGVPNLIDASNLQQPFNDLCLSFRIPPTADIIAFEKELKEVLEKNAPYGAAVKYRTLSCSPGWNALPFTKDLDQAIRSSAQTYFDADPLYRSCGGTIGLLSLFGELFSKAQIIVYGAESYDTHVHGPNEFLSIPFAEKICCNVSHWLETVSNKSLLPKR